MQFAGQRTDMDLQPIGEPVNVLIKMTDDIVPEPDAILITGITPQQTIADGITEVEFLRMFHEQVATPGTIFVGFNSVRFDDEFMRFLHYRNFYDPYEWQYTEGKSRWDLLDLVRMTRALRPEGIEWPVDGNGVPTNRLELLTKANGIDHVGAHDALSDVNAAIDVARLIRSKQPKLFDYLLKMRDKKAIAELVESGQPFVYSSGKYASEYQKTAVVVRLGSHPSRQGALVYDLRYDPGDFLNMSTKDLIQAWKLRRDDPGLKLPIKTLQYNRCPAVAPLGVLDESSKTRLQIDDTNIRQNLDILRHSSFTDKVLEALKVMDSEQQQTYRNAKTDVDGQLYDGFIQDADKKSSAEVRASSPAELGGEKIRFSDSRLVALLPRYKARNFSSSLTAEEREAWEEFRRDRLLAGGPQSRLGKFFDRLGQIAGRANIDPGQQFLLEELQLYGQSIMPFESD